MFMMKRWTIIREDKIMKYLVISHEDMNDFFEIEADNDEDAALVALDELGFSLSMSEE
jgi:hypothetical protein